VSLDKNHQQIIQKSLFIFITSFIITMILDSLKWRYATKQFDTSKKLSDADLQKLLDAFVLTPTSFGLFPFELIVVTDPAVRETLMSHSWGQRQIADASHLFILARRTDVDAAYIRKFIERTAVVR
jgi:nitroreductase